MSCNRFAEVRLHKMKFVRFTRKTLTYQTDGELITIKTRSTLSDIEPPAARRQPIPKTEKQTAKSRKTRKKTIKVYGRSVRRPKRPVRTNQIRTIDIVDEPVEIPGAFVLPKQEMVQIFGHDWQNLDGEENQLAQAADNENIEIFDDDMDKGAVVIDLFDAVTNLENGKRDELDANGGSSHGYLFIDVADDVHNTAEGNNDHESDVCGGIQSDQIFNDAADRVQVAEANGDHSTNQPLKIVSSTFCSGTTGTSAYADFGTNELSGISVNFNVSSGTRRIIEYQLREAGMNLEMYNEQNLLPTTASQNSPMANQQSVVETSEYQSGPLSPGSMPPNMSNPENMLDSAEREVIKIFHTV